MSDLQGRRRPVTWIVLAVIGLLLLALLILFACQALRGESNSQDRVLERRERRLPVRKRS